MKQLKYVVVAAFMLLGCTVERIVEPGDVVDATPLVKSPDSTSVSFSMLTQSVVATDTTIRIRVTWKAPNDGYGLPEYYLHTMTTSKVVVDATTGPLPVSKRANGLVDTVRIKLNFISDTVTLTSRLWSVRRGLQSISPAVGTLFIRRGDRPPPPPDSIKVDTLVIPGAPPVSGVSLQNSMESPLSVVNISELDNAAAYRSLFIRDEDGTTTYKVGTSTYITLIVK
jgi:hypothetical protein